MISDLKDVVNRTLFHLEQTREKFNQLTLGHLSPSVVASHELTHMLRVIEEHLPKYLFLPKAPQMTRYYYKTLTCTTLIENDKFLTIINIHLLEVNKQYELFRAHNLAVLYNSTNVLASYVLEIKHIADDMEETEYMLLTEDEANRCSVASSNLCPLIYLLIR